MIYVDMDGVVANFVAALWSHVTQWDIAEPDTSRYDLGYDDDYWRYVSTLIDDTREFWETLEPIPEGVAMVRKLTEEGIPWGFLTNPGRTRTAPSGKLRWACDVMGLCNPDQVHVVHHKYRLAMPGCILVDDSISNIAYWQQASGRRDSAWLVSRPWNTRQRPVGTLGGPLNAAFTRSLIQHYTATAWQNENH
jgi:hypothetical protein